MTVAVGSPAPQFELRDQHGQKVSRDSLLGAKSLVVFIPYPFTRVCTSELCEIRDNTALLNDIDAKVVAITVDTVGAIRRWAEEQRYEFPVLSDFWPHGGVAQAYGAFDDTYGYAKRYTFVLDEDGIVRDVVKSDELSAGREFQAVVEALEAI
ncbi:MAG TPA: redoxin domain-containing protein [Acidimicrobiia bacterium]|jgi:peroxiredoxin